MTSRSDIATGFLVRPARRTDAPALFELSGPFMADGRLRHRPFHYFVAHHRQFLVVQERRDLMGCAGVQRIVDVGGEWWVLYNLCVRSAWQGRGIGALLLEAAVDRASGPTSTDLFAASLPSNRWFVQHGFMAVDPVAAPARWVERLDPARESIIYRRHLSESSTDATARLTVTTRRSGTAS